MNIEDNLYSAKIDQTEDNMAFPYRERYLEYIINLGDNTDRYQTMLAELYIDSMFAIQEKTQTGIILLPDLINPKRKKLTDLLEEK